ncbi:peptide deformylase [Parapedobacter sp. SGR-10]|jgi:peptide deformylase|uniref:peptide deformylase n=1 Tax=Parapedobacter sp. SGR-10 TaxID=2710879 RepID=UPI0013D10BAE|nr:peptide deformylase [Parapedobacter sp. SGR-10]NGF55688.1 peptide deformylase [Parapedobacter sp. SGR-10]
MKHPILAYGHSILKQKCENIEPNFPNLSVLIDEMWETMRNANGCGLAAPQTGISKRLFIVDSKTTFEQLDKQNRKIYFDNDDKGIIETFINATIIKRSNDFWEDEEGCLSIPGLFQTVKRSWEITIQYVNKNFEPQTKTFSGTTARMIQHEYDHTEGILFLDYLKPLTKKLIESKLKKIVKGKVQTRYAMKFV